MNSLEYDTLVADITVRLANVRMEIAAAAQRSGRPATAVRLIAVTKTHPAPVLRAALQAGISEIGENYLQEASEKFAELALPEAAHGVSPLLRHAIGHIQTNKARLAVRWFDMIQTVDSVRLAEHLNRAAAEEGRVVPILLQINISKEATKSGFFFDEVAGVLPTLANLAHIHVEGLMTIGRLEPDAKAARGDFIALRNLLAQLQQVAPSGMNLYELSMGMSHDFPVAIEEGATMVRVGSRLFGPRHSA